METNTQNDKAAILRAERERRTLLEDQEKRAWHAVEAIRDAMSAIDSARHAIAATDYGGDDARRPLESLGFAAENCGHALNDIVRLIAKRQFSTAAEPENF